METVTSLLKIDSIVFFLKNASLCYNVYRKKTEKGDAMVFSLDT